MTTILVVDDNEINRKLVTELLRFEGYQCLQAADGSEGLAIARREHPRLVISDILMPSMDGYEFVRRLRADSELANVRVVFYTANYHEREARTLAETCGIARVLTKPCDASVFLRAIQEVLADSAPSPAQLPDQSFAAEHLRVLTNKLSQTSNSLESTNARLAALVHMNVQLASERDPQVLLDKLCSGARALIGARFAILAATRRAGTDTNYIATSGIETAPSLLVPQLKEGLLGTVYQQNRCRRVSNQSGAAIDAGLPRGYPPIHALLAAPVSSLTRTYGWLCLADKIGAREFSAEDEELLATLCALVGRVFENGTLYLEVQSHAAQLLVEMDERELAAAELRASEQRFRQIAENIQDVFFIMTPDLSQSLYISPGYEGIWGRSPQDVLANPLVWLQTIHPEDRERIQQDTLRLAKSLPERGEMEFRIVRADGEVRWIYSRIFPILDDRGVVARVVGVATDITGRKLAESRVVHLSRVHRMLSGINSLIVRADNRDLLLREACRLAIEHGQFRIAACSLRDPATGEFRPAAAAGDPGELIVTTVSQPGPDAAADNLIQQALRTQRVAICNDLRDVNAQVPARSELVERGYRAMVALPLVIAGNPVGYITLISDKAEFFDDEEMGLLVEFAGDISFAMDHIEKGERITFLAYYDTLTGLANRALFSERVSQHVAAAHRGATPFTVVIVNVEQLEMLNDTLGRTRAEALLRDAALRFAGIAGADLAARVGTDQLAAVIPQSRKNIDVTRAVEVLLREWLQAPFPVGEQQVTLTAHAGVASFPADGNEADTLVRNAETALKSARSGGKPYGFFAPQLGERLLERRTLERNMQRALENEEFELHYQPKVDLEARKLTGVEALIRWRSPDMGLVPPGKFIGLMEENGMIVEVGAWALRQASLDRSRWLEQKLAAPRIAVNVSAVQVRRDDFVRTVATILKLAGAEAGIDIEVTETLLMDNVAENIAKLSAIREMGVSIALDDFGTGFSSLGYLARLPVHALKIDRSFVSTMLEDPGSMTLVSTIISLASALKLQTIAEGVELEEQAKILRLLRCDQMQGYLISKPLSFDNMTTYLSRTRS